MTIRRGGRRRGTVAVIMALSLTAVVGVAAITLDGGMLLAERRRAQAVSDAAASAAAGSLSRNYAANNGLDPSGAAKTAALGIASANGYVNNGTTSNVTVNIPPASGPNSGKAGYAEVIVSYTQPRLVSALWGSGSMAAGARSVARASTPSGSAGSIIVLDPTASGALTCAGSARVKGDTSIQDNSSSVTAANANNVGHAVAPTIDIVGSYTTSSGGYFTGAMVTGAAAVADPLASLPTPSSGSLTTIPANWYAPGYGNCTMQPGVYNGGVNFTQIGGGRSVTMMSGIYYMKGGDFNFGNGCSVTDNGAGVLIYVEPGYSVKLNGGSAITLSALTSGPYAGVVFYVDRTSSAGAYIDNNSNSTITGAFYAANAAVNFAGGAPYNQAGQFICRTLNASNNTQVTINTSGIGGSTKRPVRLVE